MGKPPAQHASGAEAPDFPFRSGTIEIAPRRSENVLGKFMVKPNGRLVRVSCTHYCASTSRLSKS